MQYNNNCAFVRFINDVLYMTSPWLWIFLTQSINLKLFMVHKYTLYRIFSSLLQKCTVVYVTMKNGKAQHLQCSIRFAHIPKIPLDKLATMPTYHSVSEEQWQDISILIGCVKFPFVCQLP